jgi:GT2 family glycosyltransferase
MTIPLPARNPARVSVVVLTYNRCDELLANLDALLTNVGEAPVIVVDNGSTDGTAGRVAQRYPGVTLIRSRRNLGAAGRNLGARAVRTPYLAFCDDDTCWEPGALARAERLLDQAPNAGVVNACIRVGARGSVDPTCELMARSPLGSGPAGTMRLLGFMAGACVFRTDAFLQAGGYQQRFFIGGEETLLALDLVSMGWQILYAPYICTRHFPSSQRDGPLRAHLLARNAIWTAWLRLPARAAWQETRARLRQAHAARNAARVTLAALSGLPWVLRHRRIVPPHVERSRRQLAADPATPA